MVSLEKISGLPIKLEGSRITFDGIPTVEPDVRTIEQMRPVLLDKSISKPKECYYMYRDVCYDRDREMIEKNQLRYDITLIPAQMLGREFNKTLGHFHPKIPGTNFTYPEVYEILKGEANYILQNEKNFIVVEAGEGDKVIVPTNFGHVTVNSGKETLVMANWVERNFKSEYGPIKEKQGAMYFKTVDGWVENKNYDSIPKIKRMVPTPFHKHCEKETPLYTTGLNNIECLDFLKKPQNYLRMFDEFLK